jgi:hypothetical protein
MSPALGGPNALADDAVRLSRLTVDAAHGYIFRCQIELNLLHYVTDTTY